MLRGMLQRYAVASILALCLATLVTGCGGGSGGGSDPQTAGRVSFRIQWDRSRNAAPDFQRESITDCLDVATVTAAIYNENGRLLQTGGPWNCSEGRGVISNVPAGAYVRVVIAGHGPDGLVLYRGETPGTFFLPPGGTVDAGLVIAGSFVPSLLLPDDGYTVAPPALSLRWNPLPGARRYRATVATDAGFAASSVLQTFDVPASNTPSCGPETRDMAEGTPYYWRVQAVDGAGNWSAASQVRRFYISRAMLVPVITQPYEGAVVLHAAALAFNAIVVDSSGQPVAPESLSQISWTSSLDGQIGTQLSFSRSDLSLGSHTITLNVQQANGIAGSSSITIQVVDNLPPTATIVSPEDGASHPAQTSLSCQGSGSDPEEGALPDASFQWTLTRQSDGQVLTAVGASVAFEQVTFFEPGNYLLTLTVTDSEGASGTATVHLAVLNNLPPVATIIEPTSETLHEANSSLICAGSASDPEDGALSGEALLWTVTRLADGQSLQAVGADPVFEQYSFFVPGSYRVMLTATDSDGASVSVSVDFQTVAAANQPPSAQILEPADGDIFTPGSNVSCQGTASDPEDATIPDANLRWTVTRLSDSSSLTTTGASTVFGGNFFIQGSYRISFTATDSQGAYGTDEITITIGNLPPIAQILSPSNGYIYDPMLAGDLYCYGTGTDPEDGNITGTNMYWTVTRLSDSAVIWSDVGDFTYADYLLFSSGNYRVSLRVVDSNNASGYASHTITVP